MNKTVDSCQNCNKLKTKQGIYNKKVYITTVDTLKIIAQIHQSPLHHLL